MDAALIADLVSLGGAGVAVSDAAAGPPAAGGPGVLRVGLHRQGEVPGGDLDGYDIPLSADPHAPAPWVGLGAGLDDGLALIARQVAAQPAAAAVAAQVLRMAPAMAFDDAVVLESLAYSMLLGAGGFRDWRAHNPPRARPDEPAPRVLVTADAGGISLQLNRPASRNAFDARMRDELTEALDFALRHPDAPPVTLSGAGPAFSAGGDLDEFGRAGDVGLAHLIRTLRSPARLARALGERLTVRLHGACVGAGIEVPAAAARVVAAAGATFRLPEVGMGLIPGAGGTASLPRRIGRQRACYMAISGAEIDLPTALAWGLVDAEAAG